MSKKKQYSAKDILLIEFREHVRRRPDLYFEGTGKRALHHLIDEVLDNSIESVFVDKCEAITIRLLPDNQVTISDTAKLIPERLAEKDYREDACMYILDIIFKEIGVGHPPWDYYSGRSYTVSGGLHGVGLQAVNPVSASFAVTVYHENRVWKRSYRKGNPHGAHQKYETMESRPDGVTITFQPDYTIFDKNDFDYDLIANRCREIAYIFPNLTITLMDERTTQTQTEVFHYPDGIQAIVRDLNQGKQSLHDIVHKREVITYSDCYGKAYDTIVEIAFQYTDTSETILRGYANTVLATDGGTHVEGFRHALMEYINGASDNDIDWVQLAHGLTAIINVSHCAPQYESQTKIKLLNPDIFDAVLQTAYSLLAESNLRNLLGKHLQGTDS